LERRLRVKTSWAGVDEAGRGPLAGPVVAAAVLIPRGFDVAGIDDSKKMTASAREKEAERIKSKCRWSISSCDVHEIDSLNILRASLLAMRKAIEALDAEVAGVLIDGNQAIYGLTIDSKCVVDGDAKYAQIAAASILAKTHRDSIMRSLGAEFPEYGFERHFGYSTPEHLRAIETHGPCEAHRRSFTRIRDYHLQPCLAIED
jgi:ribonuclease HII